MNLSGVLLCLALFWSFTLQAQEAKPWLFIGTYSTAKGYCGDRVLVRKEIASMEEYNFERQRFLAEHAGFSPSTVSVSEKQCVIISTFTTDREASYKCSPVGYATFVSSTIEGCQKMMDSDARLFEKNRSVQPKSVFQRGKLGEAQKESVTLELEGVRAEIVSVSKASGGEYILAQFTNVTSDKRAVLSVKLADGTVLENQFLLPGETYTSKYASNSMDLQIIFDGAIESKSPSPIDAVKTIVRKMIINENDKIITKPSASTGVRG